MCAVHAEEPSVPPELQQWADKFVAGWNRNDARALASLWADDGDLINPFGRRATGREAIERLLQSEHTALMKGTRYEITKIAARAVKTDVAMLDWDCEVSGMKTAEGKDRPPFKHHVAWVLVHRGGQWLALAARTSAPSPAPAEALR